MIYLYSKKYILTISLFLFFSVFPTHVNAEASQILSVTPPLFQLSIKPGDIWQSSVKVVNGNPYQLTIYPEVVNFEASGENGQGKFIPILNDDERKSTLAEWVQIANGPYIIPPEQSVEIQFFVEIPKDASPGGHFAAILINTQPSQTGNSKIAVQTSQTVTSLFFVRVEGDVTEEGTIREFSVADSFGEKPEANFSLRFENKGNVLLQPRGDIIITNMWGTQRGIIPINNQTHFGNVLPYSIRNFKFSWKGEQSITDIGRYKAIATLAYGEDGIKSTTSTTYFWVIPVKATLITLGVLITFILLVTWMIKLYVRRMLVLAGVDVHYKEPKVPEFRKIDVLEKDVRLASYKHVSAPLRSGARDLKDRLSGVTEFFDVLTTIGRFILQYKKFFISLILLIVSFVGTVLYINDVSQTDRNYEITIQEGDRERKISSDEVKAGLDKPATTTNQN